MSHHEHIQSGANAIALRQRAHALIAKSPHETVRELFERMERLPTLSHVRPTDTGLIMVRGKVGGDGARFNLGELPVTRAALRIGGGQVGIGYVAGRNDDHAELAALADAMVQSPEWSDTLEQGVLKPLARELDTSKQEKGRKAAATKVEFFTMVRTRKEK
ncbi:phosphonate C-P lyase system protein PhnG [Sphingorhabdus sp.]|jgi:alpha-D-ribose 1-methylphosphonate 5-triphosphate synthase subunit PhnG|uniref:phosphonate C-P lyase system protein PhnG n=1 Tax=Sphingorhabdus sp. TaxID=1902408 RepID=UPI0037CBCBA2